MPSWSVKVMSGAGLMNSGEMTDSVSPPSSSCGQTVTEAMAAGSPSQKQENGQKRPSGPPVRALKTRRCCSVRLVMAAPVGRCGAWDWRGEPSLWRTRLVRPGAGSVYSRGTAALREGDRVVARSRNRARVLLPEDQSGAVVVSAREAKTDWLRGRTERREGRLEFWDGNTETAWKAWEPTSIYHEQPSRMLVVDGGAVRNGPRIACFSSADLERVDATGRRRWLMQADGVLHLHPDRVRLHGPAISVDLDPRRRRAQPF